MLINNSALKQSTDSNSKAVGYATYGSRQWPDGKLYIDTETYKLDQALVQQLKEACRDWTVEYDAELF